MARLAGVEQRHLDMQPHYRTSSQNFSRAAAALPLNAEARCTLVRSPRRGRN